MTPLARRGHDRTRPRARRRRAHGDGGFTLIELMVGMTVFAVMFVAFGMLFNGSLTAYEFARARTRADQIGSGEIEKARRIPWADLGTVNGNPPGVLLASETVTVGNATFTVTRRVELVDDAVPVYGNGTGANYKRVIVKVTSAAMTTPLQVETVVAPPTQPSLYSGQITAQVIDTNNQPIVGATVTVTGPSPTRSDLTTAPLGKVKFPALIPTTAANPSYTITPTMAGWKLLPADASAQQVSLPAGATPERSFHLYKPATLTLYFVDLGGQPIDGLISMTMTDSAGANPDVRTFTSANGSLVMTTFGTGDIVPYVKYRVSASAFGFTMASPLEITPVPTNYPTGTDATATVTIPVPQRVETTFTVADKVTSAPVPGVTGTLTGSVDSPLSFTTDTNGQATLKLLPATYGITVTSPPTGYVSGTWALTVPTGNTTPIAQTLQLQPWATTFTTRIAGALTPLGNVTVALTGGPTPDTSFTTAANGQFSLALAPGTYTVKVDPAPAGYDVYDGTATVTGFGSLNVDLDPAPVPVTLSTRKAFDGSAIGAISVRLVGPSGTVDVVTDASGAITTNLKPGSYTATVMTPPSGYQTSSATFVVSTATTQPIWVRGTNVSTTFFTQRQVGGNAIGSIGITLTGNGGTYSFTTAASGGSAGKSTVSLPPGTYTVTVTSNPSSYPTLQTATVSVPLTAGTTIAIKFS